MTLRSYVKLKATKSLNRMSLHRIIKLNNEVETRIELCKRAGGRPDLKTRPIKLNNGSEINLTTVTCRNGTCEECGRFSPVLECHEDHPRSLGGKVSLENSRELCPNCHRKKKGSPMWSKGVVNDS
jgi:hypothetical protein